MDLERAQHYRMKAQHYRESAAAEPDPIRRDIFELLAATLERLAAAYRRLNPQAVEAPSDSERQTMVGNDLSMRSVATRRTPPKDIK